MATYYTTIGGALGIEGIRGYWVLGVSKLNIGATTHNLRATANTQYPIPNA